jgi:hypothetical protein
VSAVLDAKISALSGEFISTKNALSDKVSVLSQAVSVLSVAVAAGGITSASAAALDDIVSAQAASIVSVLSAALSARASVLSAAAADAVSIANVVSNQVSALSAAGVSSGNVVSAKFVSILNAVSVLSQAVSVLSVAVTGGGITSASAAALDDIVSAQAASIVSVLSAALSERASALSQAISVVSVVAAEAATSAELASVDARITSVANAVSNAASANAVSIANVVSGTLDTKISDLSARYVSGLAGLSQNISVISNRVSAAHSKTYTWIISAPAVGGVYGAQIAATTKAIKIIAATISADTAIVVNVEKRPTFGAAGSNVLSADITGSATPVSQAADTSAGAATITAGNWLYLDISGTSGTPTVGIVVLEVGQP